MPKRETGLLRGRFAYDLERTAVIADLVKEGYGDKILVTNDICLKNMLRAYGGNGYAHVVTNVVPMLLDSGVSEEQIDRIYRINPGNFLDGGK